MKKIEQIAVLITAGIFTCSALSADVLSDAATLDVKKVCDVKVNGLDKVLQTAQTYNKEAVAQGVEFKRLGITNSNYIKSTLAAVKAKHKETTIKYKKKGKEKSEKFATDYAAWRACSFAIRALQQKSEAQKTWSLAVPGDGFTY